AEQGEDALEAAAQLDRESHPAVLVELDGIDRDAAGGLLVDGQDEELVAGGVLHDVGMAAVETGLAGVADPIEVALAADDVLGSASDQIEAFGPRVDGIDREGPVA